MIKRIMNRFQRAFKPMKVYALVGKAGSGKSFRARLVTEKHHIDYIIDDGLLIQGNRIVAGKSAKRETIRVKAVKRAIFLDPQHVREVKTAMARENVKSLLILGTSERMIQRITDKLDLPEPEEFIFIHDIATEEEINQARSHRKMGKHVIPVPVIEVEKEGIQIMESIKIFLKQHPILSSKKTFVEKTVVQPSFHERGRLSITDSAISQMLMHCVSEYNPDIQVSKIVICPMEKGYKIIVRIAFPLGQTIPEVLGGLQEYIIEHVEKYSGIHIQELEIMVGRLSAKLPASREARDG